MAKPKMITRTIATTIIDILCLDIDSGEACNRSFTIAGEVKKESEALKFAAKKLADTEANIHPVHVVNQSRIETLYGMTEADFIAHSVIMPNKEKRTIPATSEDATPNAETVNS